MKKLIQEPLFYFLLYCQMVILTFGHAYVHFPAGYTSSWSTSGTVIAYGIAEKSIGSFIASIGWPFYWSAQLWK